MYKTEEEKFWAGKFGDDYIERNNNTNLLASNLSFFSKATRLMEKPVKCIEFGANIGMNIKALKLLYPEMINYGIELNKVAAETLGKQISPKRIFNCSVLDFCSNKKWDLVLTKGLLIHINPNELTELYEKMVNACSRYLLIAEYYNPIPQSVAYRGHANKLYKRDFAGEILKLHSNFSLKDYGFVYKNDPNFPQDDITWFLMEKHKS